LYLVIYHNYDYTRNPDWVRKYFGNNFHYRWGLRTVLYAGKRPVVF